jgi:iron complex outermembrane receptor protein
LNKIILLASTAVLGFGSMGSAAWAQSAAPANQGIEEVVVTAQRSQQNLQKVSETVTAIAGDKLESLGVKSVEDLASVVTGVQIKPGNAPAIFIRGIGTSLISITGDSGVAIHSDGVFLTRSTALNDGFYDLERVEVLKGPQGTLYGRGSIGGSVNLITSAPKMKFEANVTADAGNYNMFGAQGAVNIPLDEGTQTAIRVAFEAQSHDAYADNGTDDANNNGLRVRVRSKPITGLTLDLIASQYSSKTAGIGFYPAISYPATSTTPARIADVNDWHSFYDQSNNFNNLKIKSASLNVDYDMGFAVLTVLPSYTIIDNPVFTDNIATVNGIPGSTVNSYSNVHDVSGTQEARLSSPAGSKLKWVVGVYHLNEKNRYDLANHIIKGWVDTNSSSVFAQATYPILDNLRIIGGIRQTDEHKINPTNVVGLAPFTAHWTPINYRGSAEFDVNPSSMLYLTYSTGFKAGGFFTSAPISAYNPETVKVYEVGSKNRFLDGTLQVNAAAYFSQYDAYQVNVTIVPAFVGATSAGVFNGGNAQVKGAELEAIYELTPYDRFDASVNYTDAKFTTITVTGTSAKVGDQLPNSPPYTSNLAYTHDFVVPTGKVSFRVSTHLETQSWLSLNHNSLTSEGAYSKSDIAVTYAPESAKYTFAIWARNLENKAVLGSIIETANNQNYALGPPRTFGLTVSAKF